MVDKMLGKAVQEIVGDGEKKAPVKSVKLKVKFGKAKRKAPLNQPMPKSNQVPPNPFTPTVGRSAKSMGKLKRGMRGLSR